ncbi:lysozyme-like domain-containing protein [Chytriomyces sp. MP71]|nr:lysozyme-like domain-containing protein [Chytriomyces sp. MP71]
MSLVWTAENSEGDLTGVVPWYKAYSYIQNIGDGRGFTTNIVGFCTGTGDFLVFLKNLQKISPCHPLTKYIPDVQALSAANSGTLVGLKGLPQLVLDYGGGASGSGPIDPAYVQATWDTLSALTDSGYWGTAMSYSRQFFLSLPISKGQLYDIGLNAGTDGLKTVISRVKTPPPTAATSGTTAEVNWLLDLQSQWINYIATTPSIDDGQLDRGLMWQHLVDPSKTQKNSKGQVGANNDVPNLKLSFPLSVNCYGSTLNIQAPVVPSTSTNTLKSTSKPTTPSASQSPFTTSKIPTSSSIIFSSSTSKSSSTPAASTPVIKSTTSSPVSSTLAMKSTTSNTVIKPSTSSPSATSAGNTVSDGAVCSTFGAWACNYICICNYTATAAGNILVWQCSNPSATCGA